MTLLETTRLLEYIAKQYPNINGIVESGDIFDLNKEDFQQKYSAFCATQRQHNIGPEYTTFSFTLYYVDRLTLDKSDKIEIQSNGVTFFQNFIETILEKYHNLNISNGNVITFTEKFSAECAGAYMDIDITTTNQSLCSLIIEEYKKKGEFAPTQFSDAFFKWAETKL